MGSQHGRYRPQSAGGGAAMTSPAVADQGLGLPRSRSARSTASASNRPASFSALVPLSMARCCSRLCRASVAWMKNLLGTLPPSCAFMARKYSGSQIVFATYLTDVCYVMYNRQSSGCGSAGRCVADQPGPRYEIFRCPANAKARIGWPQLWTEGTAPKLVLVIAL